MNQLDVYNGSDLTGHLHNQEDGLVFLYASSWLASPGATPLAPGLPLEDLAFHGDAVNSFFENLLPEGHVREFIAKSLQLSPENVFGLLERLGGDTAGAYSILPAGTKPGSEAHYLEVSREAIKEWLTETKGVPLTLHSPDARMSLSGAQDKLTVFIDADGKLFLPKGDAPSTHIIKPAISYRQDVPHSAINEAAIMILASRVGLDTAEVRFDRYLNSAVITRYDRTRPSFGDVSRLHQLDFCQLLDMPSSKKYESEGGPTFKQCMEVVRTHSSQPAVDIKRLIEWVAFNVIVGNMDSHAKNLSMLYVGGKARMSPFYDLVATLVYPNLSKRFAFKVGGENRPEWIQGRHWDRLATETGLRPTYVRKIVTDMASVISHKLPLVMTELTQGNPDVDSVGFLSKIEQSITRTLRRISVAKEAEEQLARKNIEEPTPGEY